MSNSSLIVGLDIGTTKICAVAGEITENGLIEIIGIGTSKSLGMRQGVVVNIEQTVQAIRQAVDDAEMMAGKEITSVYAGIAGNHITSINNDGMISIKGGIVSEKDIERVIDSARVFALPGDRIVIHTLPQEFIVDDQRGIVDPLGMSGVRLEAKVHIVTGAVSSAQNIMRSCHRSNLDVSELVLESLASAKAVLTQEEREIGVALVDIGGGTTDISIFANNSIKYTGGLNMGGQVISNDIARVMSTPLAAAEKLKIRYGCALADLVPMNEMIEVSSVGGRPPTREKRHFLASICEPRMDEILTYVDELLIRSNYKEYLGAGVVLTGGTALMEGCQELAREIFDTPTRIGYPRDIGGLKDVVNNPKFATAVGLIRYGMEREMAGIKSSIPRNDAGLWNRIVSTMSKWFKEVS